MKAQAMRRIARPPRPTRNADPARRDRAPRRLLADDISLERAYGEIHAERLCGRAAASTVETLMFSLRAGVTALGKPDTLRRLSELSDTQLRDVAVRLQKFTAEIARPWPPEDIEVLLATRSKIRGQDA
jgi:uncharacterized protein YjiS (DUF1127 family)